MAKVHLANLQRQNSKLIVEMAKLREHNDNLGEMVQASNTNDANADTTTERNDNPRGVGPEMRTPLRTTSLNPHPPTHARAFASAPVRSFRSRPALPR